MQSPPITHPITKDLVLIGGGHSHAIVLKQFGMRPLPGVRLTLITDVGHTPYSGMLPGYVAGHYSFDQCHIDLRPLSQFAGAQMIVEQAIGLDLQQKCVQLAGRPPIAFDVLSIDIGSTPAVHTVPGAAEHTIPVKPISQFLRYWDELVQTVAQTAPRLVIVGGGAGGVELALSVQARLQCLYQQTGLRPDIHLIHRGDRLLPERSAGASRRLQQVMTQRGITLHLQETVAAITPRPSAAKAIHCQSGLTLECDGVFWVTQASAAPWLAQAGLAVTDQGFIQVNDRLQSLSHPFVFAAGDVATVMPHPRPKAGVFAVRQGKPLARNLRRALLDIPLQPFVPQREFLILLGTGDRQAVASRGAFTLGPYSWIWRWKDAIDRRFMNQFSALQPMTAKPPTSPLSPSSPPPPLPCAGCGSKVGSSVLEQAFTRIQREHPFTQQDDILIGLDAPDDAAVIRVPDGQVMVQTIDYFRALIDDPYVFGQIAASHCLSDIFAMGARPQSALAIVTLPPATAAKQAEQLYQLLSGAIAVLQQTPLIGGHTVEGSDLAFGLTCNGLVTPEQLWRKSGMQPGEALVLTKALGTGTLFAADMQLKARGDWIEAAVRSMVQSNQAAVACLRQHQVSACTDVTGFGLLGHLLEMVRASQVAVAIDLYAVPVLPGAKETLHQGIVSSLHAQNLQAARWIANLSQVSDRPLYPLLFDPQTSGGLLAAVPADRAVECVADLRAIGYPQSCIIGRVLEREDNPLVSVNE